MGRISAGFRISDFEFRICRSTPTGRKDFAPEGSDVENAMIRDVSTREWSWTAAEREVLDRLDSPPAVQDFLMDACFAGADPDGRFKPTVAP